MIGLVIENRMNNSAVRGLCFGALHLWLVLCLFITNVVGALHLEFVGVDYLCGKGEGQRPETFIEKGLFGKEDKVQRTVTKNTGMC